MERPPRQRNLPQVRLRDTDQRLGGEAAPQPCCQPGVPLDRDHSGPGPGERTGQRAIPGPEIEDQIPGANTAGVDELSDQPSVSKKMSADRIRRERPPPWHGIT